MAAVVSLRDIVEALDLPRDDWAAYLNPDTGEVVVVSEEDERLVEEGEADGLPDWQREILPKVRQALESGRFLKLPDRFEIHEWSIMERFALERADDRQRADLLKAIRGSGAFRYFRDTIRRLGIEDQWYRFRDATLEAIAKEWLEANNISYK